MPQSINVQALEDGIVLLQLDDAEQENRLSDELCSELTVVLAGLAQQAALKVLVLAGRRDVFCAGASLDTLKEIAAGRADVKDLLLPHQLLSFPVPIVGALTGHAVGGGLALALCCDILVAAQGSRYGVNFVNLGFTPGMGITALLPALVGHQFASEMMMTGKLYKGKELQMRGLFNHVVPASEVMPQAVDIARRMAEKPKHVLELLKNTLSLPRIKALQEALAREHAMHQVCFRDELVMRNLEQSYLMAPQQ